MKSIIEKELVSHVETAQNVLGSLQEKIEKSSEIIVKAIRNGNKVLLCGNGGSAADAQHIAAEFTGRYKVERRGLPAIALTTDTSALTAIGNDYGYDRVFDRQVEALSQKGDILIGISSTGNSKNVINAFQKAKEMGCMTLGLSGKGGGKFNESCDINLVIPSNDTPRIQEMHIVIGHIICTIIDEFYDS